MLKQNNGILRKALQAADIAVTAVSFLLAYAARHYWGSSLGPLESISEYQFLMFIIVPLWAVLLYYNGAYGPIRTKGLAHIIVPILKTVFTGGVVLMTILYIGRLEFVSRALLLFFLFFDAVLLSALKVSIYLFMHYIRKKGFNYRSVVIVGTGRRAESYARAMEQHREWGVKVVGFVELAENASVGHVNVIGYIDNLKTIITTLQIDEVVFVVPRKWLDRIEEQILVCEQVGIKASIAADFYPHSIAKVYMEELMGVPLIVFNPTHRFEKSLVAKRTTDILLAGAAFLLTLPLFVIVSVLIKVTVPGPVFFKQGRCGLNGRRFNVLKFRTMVDNADGMKDRLGHLNEMSGPVFKIKKDPRVTPVGRFLRKYSLDELPQLINVLMGDMSIVGPRPPIPAEVDKYNIWQRRRLSVRPGITCSWQVSGRNNIGFDDWVRLDLEYIDNWTFKQDIEIMLKTIPVVLRGTGF